MEQQPTPQLPHLENYEMKKNMYNKFWNDQSFKIENNGELLTMKECYTKTIERSQLIFNETQKIAREQIPDGKYILYINSTLEGVAGNPDLQYIDQERIQSLYEAETGDTKIDQHHFQERNMRHCLGFEKNDSEHFKIVNSFSDPMPTDLSRCVGIVFSGSEADITDESHLERIHMIERARTLVKNSNELKIPKLGICFGGQLLANEEGAAITWITDHEGNKKRITGINKLSRSEDAHTLPVGIDFTQSDFYVAQNHGQKIDKETLPPTAHILAENNAGDIEMVYFEDTNTLCTQFHPEVSSIRLDIAESMNTRNSNPAELFIKHPDEIGRELFPHFLKRAGAYARTE